MCIMNTNYRITTTPYSPDTVCFRYICVNTLHKGNTELIIAIIIIIIIIIIN